MIKRIFGKMLSNILTGLGTILILSPIALYWLIHGNYERYIWIINGHTRLVALEADHFRYLCIWGYLL